MTPPQKPITCFCKFGHLGVTPPQKNNHMLSVKSPLTWFLKRKEDNSGTIQIHQSLLLCLEKEELLKKKKKKTVHIVPSFRANLLHGSLETRRANWFLHSFFFFDHSHCARISGTVFSNGTNKQGPVCLFGTGRGTGELVKARVGWGRGRGWREGSGGRRGGESGGSNSTIRACCIDSDRGLKAKSKCFHSRWKWLYVGWHWHSALWRSPGVTASLNTAACSICQ